MSQELRTQLLASLDLEAKLIGVLLEMGAAKWVPAERLEETDRFRKLQRERFLVCSDHLNDIPWREKASLETLNNMAKDLALLKWRMAHTRKHIRRAQEEFSSPTMSSNVVAQLVEDVRKSLERTPNTGAQALFDQGVAYQNLFQHSGSAAMIRTAAAKLKSAQQLLLGF